MERFEEILSLIPDVFWVALLAPTVTFIGVLLTNRHFATRQAAQILHEKEESDVARKFALREAIYLEAAAEIIAANQYLANLSGVDIVKNNAADELASFFIATTKAALVASDPTAKKINALMTGYTKSFFSLLGKCPPIQAARDDRDIQNAAWERYQSEIARILASMTQFNEEVRADPKVWNALLESLDFNMKQSDKAAADRSAAWDELNALTIAFSGEVMPELRTVWQLTIPTLVAVRSELGISSDIEAYERDFEERYETFEREMSAFIDKVRSDAA